MKKWSHELRPFTVLALVDLLVVTGCMSQAQFLASRQPTAIQAAVSRGQFELNCPDAIGQVLFARGYAARITGTHRAGRRTRPVHDRRCGLRPTASLSSVCPMGGDNCTALEGRTG